MTTNSDFEITNGKIKLPYNFNDEKYIIGIEKRSDNTLVAGKTIIPIKDSKPSYILEVTPKTTPTFHLTKSGEGVYKIIANKVYFNINFIVDEIPLTTSDCQFDIDWKDKYELKTTNLPNEIEIVLKENYTTITRESNYYEILENNGVFSDKINLNIIEKETQIVYSTVLEIVFQKSYFETISKYDSIDIAQHSDKREIKKNVISIDGYYNDNKVNKEDLKIKLNTNESGFTSIASTMGYIGITKEKNEWYLTHKELSKTECENNPFYNWYVDSSKNIYCKTDDGGKLIVNGNTLYDYDDKEKIFDSNGNVYDGTTKLIDNSGNTFYGGSKIIDNSGNTLLNSTLKIDNSGNTLYNNYRIINKTGGNKLNDLSGSTLADLNSKKIYNSNTAITYNYDENKIVSAGTSNSSLILLSGNTVPCYQSNYDIEKKQLYSGNTTSCLLYDHNSGYTYVNDNIFINNKEFYYSDNSGDTKIIDSDGNVSGISGFGYNIVNGIIKDNSGETIVTVINQYNTGTTNNTTSSVLFDSDYTGPNGFYIANLDGSLKYNNRKTLLSAQTIYNSDGNIILKHNSSNIRFQLVDGYWIQLSSIYSTSTFLNVTGYTTSTSTAQTFVISGNTCTSYNSSYYSTGQTGSTWELKTKTGTTVVKYDSGNLTFYLKDEKKLTRGNGVIELGGGIKYNRTDGKFTYNDNEFASVSYTNISYKYIILNNNYRYFPSYKAIQKGTNSSYSSLYPHVVLSSLTFNNYSTFSGGTQIVNGVIRYEKNDILSGGTGTIKLQNNNKYLYCYKTDSIYHSSVNNNYLILSGGSLYYKYNSAHKVIFNIPFDQLKNPSNGTTILSGDSFYCKNNYYFDIDKKKLTNNNNYNVNFNTDEIIIEIGDDYDIGYDDNNSYSITGSNINLEVSLKNITPVIVLDKTNDYSLTASTRNDRSIKNIVLKKNDDNVLSYSLTAETVTANTDNKKTISVTGITVEQIYNNQLKKYEWDKASGNIIHEGYVITNNSNDRLFYYCNEKGEILINGKPVEYITTNGGKYYSLKTGKQVILKDGEDFIDTTTLSILPEKNKILDKHNNIKVTKDTSYDLINKVEKDNNDKVITGVTTGESFTINDIFSTVAIDFNNRKIFDSNNRLISDISGRTIIIEGGLTISGDSIYTGNTVLVCGITSSDNIVLTSNASRYNVTLSGDTVYYRNKKAYSVNEGGFYFEKKINELFSTGFTLSNGLEITPLKQPQVKSANDGNSGDRPDYTHGVVIKDKTKPGFAVYVTFDDKGEGGGSIQIGYDGDDNPGFTTGGTGDLIYNNLTIISGETKQLLNPRDPLEMRNGKIWVNYMRDDYAGVVDLGGEKVDTETKDKNVVYYDAHNINAIKENIPDLISYMLKQNKNAFDIDIEATYIDVMSDIKKYTLIEGGNNNSSYEIKVEPQFITSNMITNGSTVIASIVNNNGDHIDNNTYTSNNYEFTYSFDGFSGETNVTEDTLKITLSTGIPIFNEIKFSLKCDGKLVKQEIVEVLGENKFITSTEYINNTDTGVTFTITETANTYYNTDINWGIEKGLTDVKLINNNLTIPSGVTGTVILSGTCNNIKVYEKAIVITKNGDKGEPGPQGPSGETGNPGPRGKLLYPAGRWDSGTTYYGTDDEKTPFVTYKVDDEDKYFVLTATTNISGTSYEPIKSGWTEMAQYEALYTKLLVAENGLVGGSVYNGDYVFSKDGTVNNITSNEYDKFLNTGLPLVDMIFSGDSEYHYHDTFIPNYLVDFNKGRAWFGGGKTKIDETGTVYTKDIVNIFDETRLPIPHDGGVYGDYSWDLKDVYISKNRTGLTDCFVKYIKNIDSFVFDDYQACVTENQILCLLLPDEIIKNKNVWYKGVIYLVKDCSDKLLDITHYYTKRGGNVNYHNYYHIYNNGTTRIEYMFKWNGNTASKRYYYQSGSPNGVPLSYKTGELILLDNLTEFNWTSINGGTGAAMTAIIEES